MPFHLANRLAVVALIGVFLIPVGQSTLRGLDHVLTCREQVATPFQVLVEDGQAVVTGSSTLSADEPTTLCGGLTVDLGVAVRDGVVELSVPIANRTDADWYGTVQLDIAGVRIPIDLGRVPPGQVATRTVELRLPDETFEFDGVLLVGP